MGCFCSRDTQHRVVEDGAYVELRESGQRASRKSLTRSQRGEAKVSLQNHLLNTQDSGSSDSLLSISSRASIDHADLPPRFLSEGSGVFTSKEWKEPGAFSKSHSFTLSQLQSTSDKSTGLELFLPMVREHELSYDLLKDAAGALFCVLLIFASL
jgi:hypothetical protein